MKRILTSLLLVFLALPLANCETTSTLGPPVKTVVVAPPVNFYKCPLPKKPDPKTLTDSQTADYLNRLFKARSTCRASLNAIKRYSDQAVQEVEGPQKKN